MKNRIFALLVALAMLLDDGLGKRCNQFGDFHSFLSFLGVRCKTNKKERRLLASLCLHSSY